MVSLSDNIALLAIASLSILAYTFLRNSDKKPPGPFRLPIIGNAHQMPVDSPWLTFTEWKKKYGDIIHVDILGRPLVIINSAKVARELMDKRSAVYSDRPHFIMAGDLVGYGETFVLQPYGENWRQQRKLIAQAFGQASIPRCYSLQEKEAQILIKNVLKDPSSLFTQIKLRIGVIIIRVTYGYYVKDETDPFLTTPLKAMDNFSEASIPGNFMVDVLPFMRNLPSWMPGSGFLQTAKAWRKIFYDASYNPYEWSKQNLRTGKTLLPSLCGTLLQNADGELPDETEERLVWAATSMMGGGLDTNMTTALSFFLDMLLYPDIQHKAQIEVDSVVGTDKLPEVKDIASLPFIRSIVTEVLRLHPAIPMGIPHAVTQDDSYNGMLIKKGTMVMANVWHMLHDPEVYPDPMDFKPERYNNDDTEMQKVINLAFGFGRRACPGIHFAFGTLYSIVLTTLATCDILPALNANEDKIIPSVKYSSGTIRYIIRFISVIYDGLSGVVFLSTSPCTLKPRSSKAETLLAEVATVP
ncbi:hypothetical protein M422DRAFT_188789 [Sphaerobolus stellatus SS14]|uniref:Cytochrome P450 n=1 Tax=Sphaerobolus stellatus (strain SS14) TaxID=990650 RepID=A0A0C9TI68_SPHS4|nr:hypothetical protein M422DRAFT_188789 [Sphaerobolus stellatus SS14]